ncbi:MAG: hypothetical protein K2X37_01045, partial [Chitinophagaceae bacterium]|nr:hypothetical protein [Chitinophagaceae bacterium]
ARCTAIIKNFKWNKVKQKAEQHTISSTSLALYVYGEVLSRWSGSAKFCINLTLFNRLPLHEQVNDILGDFTVLELFNYNRSSNSIQTSLQNIHEELWNDIEHNLFDGIDFQRLIRKELNIAQNKSLSPIVLTSMLGNKLFDFSIDGYISNGYSITQTSQVYLDNKAYETNEGFVAEWDYVEDLFDPQIIKQMHKDYCNLIEYLAEANWDEQLPKVELSKIISLVPSIKKLNVF